MKVIVNHSTQVLAHDTNDLEQTLNAFETSMKVYIKSKK